MSPSKNTDRDLARLLAGRDEPSVLEREAAWANIDAQLPKRKRRLWQGGLLGALAAGAALFVLAPQDDGGFSTRGAVTPLVRAACVAQGGQSSCRAGSRLALELGAPADKPYFATFRQAPGGKITWMLPAADSETATVATLPRSAALPQAFVWSGDPGEHTVFAVFSAEPLSRAQLEQRLGDSLEGDDSLLVVRRQIEAQ